VRKAAKEALSRLRSEDPNEDKSDEHCGQPQIDQPRPERPYHGKPPPGTGPLFDREVFGIITHRWRQLPRERIPFLGIEVPPNNGLAPSRLGMIWRCRTQG
jgi:hypothetical protein